MLIPAVASFHQIFHDVQSQVIDAVGEGEAHPLGKLFGGGQQPGEEFQPAGENRQFFSVRHGRVPVGAPGEAE